MLSCMSNYTEQDFADMDRAAGERSDRLAELRAARPLKYCSDCKQLLGRKVDPRATEALCADCWDAQVRWEKAQDDQDPVDFVDYERSDAASFDGTYDYADDEGKG